MKPCIAYITTKNKQEAKKLGKLLVEKNIVACINIFNNINSIYSWEGKIMDEKETVIIAKTRESNTEKLVRFVKENHSYTCPCVIIVPIVNGNPEYLDWIIQETHLH
ncbi:MAG: divalent-cation tolerance protein CutA [Leptospiraceae bacterium]|nr:divalent-cation tolerance protein CutA [Leptospiraceae bacterium]MCK6380049.1 divalent-cation tolerance protein CutA [Leptospiraceae bacterium]NUM40642.1 divalent-cation tolerance protein CutA [Leptospiraceae bacterium]